MRAKKVTRADEPLGPQLRVRLRREKGDFLEGQIAALASETLTARFPSDSGLALPLGTREPLVIVGGGPQTLHEARVVKRSTHDGWIEYTFQAAGAGSFTTDGGRNRRSAYRVTIPEKSPVFVSLTPLDKRDTFEPITTRVADVSRLGIGVAIPDEAEDLLFEVESLHVTFALPGDDQAFEFATIVRQRRFQGVFLRYGLEFDPRRTPSHGQQEERLNRYVMKRQIELIRRSNRWGRAI